MKIETDNWSVENYIDSKGHAPVEEFLNALPFDDRVRIVRTIEMLEDFGLQLSAPYVKHLQGKLWELRIRTGRKAYRVIYFAFTGRRFVLLHAFLKKTQKTPKKELATAERRLADFLAYEETS